MNNKVVLGCHCPRIGGPDACLTVFRGKSRLVRPSLIDAITRIATIPSLHRTVAPIRIDHSVHAAEIAFSVKSAEFPVVDGYSRCHSRNSARNHLSDSLRNALIANALRVMFTQPMTNSINSRCRYPRLHQSKCLMIKGGSSSDLR